MVIKKYAIPGTVLDPSYFPSVSAVPMDCTWEWVLSVITGDDAVRRNTEAAREALAAGDSKRYSRLKQQCGAVTPCGQFERGHRAEQLVRVTGLAMLDFDHIPQERMAAAKLAAAEDAHTFLCHTTCSGLGLRVLAPYTSPEAEVAYIRAWRWAADYYQMLLGLEADGATKDVTRLSFLCHDAEAVLNRGARAFLVGEAETDYGLPDKARRGTGEGYMRGASAAPRNEHSHGSAPGERTGAAAMPPHTGQGRGRMDAFEFAEGVLARQGYAWQEGQRHQYMREAAFLLNKMGVEREEVVSYFAGRHEDAGEVRRLVEWVYERAAGQFDTFHPRQARRTGGGRTAGNGESERGGGEADAYGIEWGNKRSGEGGGEADAYWTEGDNKRSGEGGSEGGDETLTRECAVAALGQAHLNADSVGSSPTESLQKRTQRGGKGEADGGTTDGGRAKSGKAAGGREGGASARTRKGQVMEALRGYVEERLRLRHNAVTTLTEIRLEDGSWVDLDDRRLNWLWLEAIEEVEGYVSLGDFSATINSLTVPTFDPFREYFEGLPEYDPSTGRDYIGELAARVKTTAPEGMFEECFRRWMVAMVGSWLEPQTMNHTILTLIGEQGSYKSTFLRRLLPPELGRYFMAKLGNSYLSKDDKIAISSYGLIAMEEIDAMRDADLAALKAVVPTEVVSERAAYARLRQNRAHLASFCATGNNRYFLTDLSGHRRFLPFEVTRIESPYEYEIPYEGLYGQCLYLLRSGFRHWFTAEDEKRMAGYKAGFETPCLEYELVTKYYRPAEGYECPSFYTVSEIVARCEADMRGRLSATRMGQVLSGRLGYTPKKRGGRRGYLLVARSYDEIREEALVPKGEL